MTTLAEVNIVNVWRVLGGPELRHGRAPAFWRGSKDLNVSIDAERGLWCDHADGEGGGILALVQTVVQCDKAAAVAWLESYGFLTPRQFSTPERRQFRQAAEAAPSLAQESADWAAGLSLWAEDRKRDLVGAIETLASLGLDDLTRDLELQLVQLRPALQVGEISAKALLGWFVAARRESPNAVARFIEIGRADRRDAEFVTAGIVKMLAIAQEGRAA